MAIGGREPRQREQKEVRPHSGHQRMVWSDLQQAQETGNMKIVADPQRSFNCDSLYISVARQAQKEKKKGTQRQNHIYSPLFSLCTLAYPRPNPLSQLSRLHTRG